MYNSPMISIAIASYNYSQYLIDALDAIKVQKYTDYEVIICDDNSTDDTVEKVGDYIKQNPEMNIKLFVNDQNRGILYNKTRLISLCSGKYIMFCDSDDKMAEDCLDTLIQAALKEDADCVVGEVVDISDDGKVYQVQDFSENPSKWMCTILHGVLFKREIIVDNDISFKIMPEDAYFILKFNQFSNKTVFVRTPVYYWRVHVDSEGRNKKEIAPEWIIEHFKDIIKFIDDTIDTLKEGSTSEEKFGEIEVIELLLLKLYYLLPLHPLRFVRGWEKYECYFTLNKILKETHPNYLKNKYLKFSVASPARPYATKIIRMCALFERMKCFPIVLFFYYILRKFVYFDE